MEMKDRIRILRKDYLKMSQAAFGERLGVNRDVINNIENNRLARPDQKLSLIKLMCKEFSVNEEWLLHGNEPMFAEKDVFSLDEFAKARGASEIELEILKVYFEIDPKIRHVLIDHLQSHFTKAPGAPDTPGELEKQCPPVEDETQAG